MTFYETIKTYLHVGNVSLGAYLGLVHNYMRQVISGYRELNGQRYLDAVKLYEYIEASDTVAKVPEVEAAFGWSAADASALQRAHNKKRRVLERKQAELARVQQQRQYWLQGLAACRRLLAEADLTEQQRQWVARRDEHLQQTINEKASLLTQRLLQAEITALQAQVDALMQ